jgi:hypothetical protein
VCVSAVRASSPVGRVGDFATAAALLEGHSRGGATHLTDALGRNALHWSTIYRHFDIVMLLLRLGAVDPTAADLEVCMSCVTACWRLLAGQGGGVGSRIVGP